MTSISTTARAIEQIFADRSGRWDDALARAIRKAVVTTHNVAQDFLSGSGAPGSYPVPVRKGFLRRAMGFEITSQTSGIVYNDAGYAHALHSGVIAVGFKGRGRKQVKPRPFLDDALRIAAPGYLITQAMSKAL